MKGNKSQKVAQAGAKPQRAAGRIVLGCAFLLVATIVVYIPAMRAGFIWDDPEYVVHNPTLRSIDGLRQMWLDPTSLPQWYPLVHTTFWIEYHLVGTEPMLYHIDNVLLHAISCVLLWRLLKRLGVPGAFFAASIFAVHPVMVESVAWVTERKNVLSLVFYLLAMREYLFKFALVEDAEKRNWRAYALSLVFFLCALFSKTVTASLPAAILLILWWKNGRLRLRELWPLIPFFILGIGLGVETAHLEATHVDSIGQLSVELKFSLAQRCLIAGRAIWFYVGKLLFPHPLMFIYPRWNEIATPTIAQWIWPALVVLVSIALLAFQRRIGRGPIVAWLLFCGTLFPALGFVNVYPMRYSFVADHFQYHAAIAMIALFACAPCYLPVTPRRVVCAIILCVLGYLTWNQTHIYRDGWTLWMDTRAKNPGSWMVWTNLGNLLAKQEKYDEAMPYYLKAMELGPTIDEARWNAGQAYARQHNLDEAERQFDEVIRINPRFPGSYESLGELYLFDRNDVPAAIVYLKKALALAPRFSKAHYAYGIALQRQADEAAERARKSRDPADAQAWLEKLSEAIDQYRQAIESNPDDRDAHYNLANCLAQEQKLPEAIDELREAIRVDPTYAQAWTNLGSYYFQSGQFHEAANAFQQALQIKPDLEPALRGLAASRQRMQ